MVALHSTRPHSMQLVMQLKDTIATLRHENAALSDAFCLLCTGTADWPTLLESLPRHVAARLPTAAPRSLSPPPSAPASGPLRPAPPARLTSASGESALEAIGDSGQVRSNELDYTAQQLPGIAAAAVSSSSDLRQDCGNQNTAIAAMEAEFKELLGSARCSACMRHAASGNAVYTRDPSRVPESCICWSMVCTQVLFGACNYDSHMTQCPLYHCSLE